MRKGIVYSVTWALVFVVAGLAWEPGPVRGQSASGSAKKMAQLAAKAWKTPKTPWGEPDLRGVWSDETNVPIERPDSVKGREFLTDEEVVAREAQAQADFKRRTEEGPDSGRRFNPASPIAGQETNRFWSDNLRLRQVSRRTSQIVEPADGKMPVNAEYKKRYDYLEKVDSSFPPADHHDNSWLDRDGGERCLSDGIEGMWEEFNFPSQILQGPGFVVVEIEYLRERKIIPTDGRPHLGANIRSYQGDSVGHWEGDTLVIDTTNYHEKPEYNYQPPFRPGDLGNPWRSPRSMTHMVERFTRVGPDTLEYDMRLENPQVLTAPVRLINDLVRVDTPFLEYACHENNYTMLHILSQARNLDKAEAAKKSAK